MISMAGTRASLLCVWDLSPMLCRTQTMLQDSASSYNRAMGTNSGASSGAANATDETWTTRRLLRWMTDHFQAKGLDSPQKMAQMLLAHVLGCERLRLFMEADRPASAAERSVLRDLVGRALNHEPVQYLVGHEWFFSRQFEVDRSTLIPRPCTETLVEHVLQWVRRRPGGGRGAEGGSALSSAAGLRIADVGTGTGCIAVSLAAQLPGARVVATDIVAAALDLARRNAVRHKVDDRIEWRLGDGLAPLADGPAGQRYDVICSNPPYIPDHEWDAVASNVKDHEPVSALRGGVDGLAVLRPLIEGARAMLEPGGMLAVEIAHCLRDEAFEIARRAGFSGPTVLKDQENLWRVLVAEKD